MHLRKWPAAAEVIGFSHAAFHYYKDRDPDFARAWHQALHGTAMGLEVDATGSFAALSGEEKVELFGPLFAE